MPIRRQRRPGMIRTAARTSGTAGTSRPGTTAVSRGAVRHPGGPRHLAEVAR